MKHTEEKIMTIRVTEYLRHPLKGCTEMEAEKLDRIVNSYYIHKGNYWMHKTRLKLIVNPILRRLQFWTDIPYVIASTTEFIKGYPNFIGYVLIRTQKLD